MIKALLHALRATPFHPQWLMRFSKGSTEYLKQLRGCVLDVGAANRQIESALNERCSYVALDYPPTGSGLYDSKPDVHGDAAFLPFKVNSFDHVVMLEVLEHVAEPRRALAEAFCVLKPSGRLLLTMPFLYPMYDEPFDFQRFTRHGLAREVRKSGLTVSRLVPMQSAMESAGMLFALALGGSGLQAVKTRSTGVLLLPVIGMLIFLVNISAWTAARCLPDWPAFTKGWLLLAIKQPELSSDGDR